jgi:hypothetical protein
LKVAVSVAAVLGENLTMSTEQLEFLELLNTIPVPSKCSLEAIIDTFQANIIKISTEIKGDSLVFLSSGFIITASSDISSSVVIQTNIDLDINKYPELAVLARAYAMKHRVSLEAYYFHDTRQAMFAFGTMDGTLQLENLSEIPVSGALSRQL